MPPMASLGPRVSRSAVVRCCYSKAGLHKLDLLTPTGRLLLHPQMIHTHHHSPLTRSGEAEQLLSTPSALPNHDDDDDDDVFMITCSGAGGAGGSAAQHQDADFQRL